ncbi:MAG: 30S ribosomal protein S8 [Alphaproteobacteria bacterium]
MAINDPIGDMLTRLRNAQKAGHRKVLVPDSRFRRDVLDVLKREGYILGYALQQLREGVSQIQVDLRYYEGEPVISRSERVSKPGRRFYGKTSKIPKVLNGLGVFVLSTSKGVLSDAEARRLNVGGEILCRIF